MNITCKVRNYYLYNNYGETMKGLDNPGSIGVYWSDTFYVDFHGKFYELVKAIADKYQYEILSEITMTSMETEINSLVYNFIMQDMISFNTNKFKENIEIKRSEFFDEF